MKKFFALFIAAAISIGASAATLLPIQLLSPAGSTSGQAIVSTGASTAPAWGGVPVGGLAAIASNSVIANATNSSAIPTAVMVTGCNGAAQALQWTNGTGFGCNSAIATSGANANITSLTGLATPLSIAQGGTASATATGTGSVVLASSPTIATPNITGVTNGSSAAAGSVGEYPSATNLTGVSLTNATATNASSISLTAGDYDVSCTGIFSPAVTTVPLASIVSISTSSAGLPSPASGQETLLQMTFSTGGQISLPSPVVRISVTVTTPVFCVVQLNFTTSTATVAGIMRARRIH